MSILKELKLKDLVTLLGTLCGISSIIVSVDGRYPWIAASLIFFAMIFDLLDGFVAKLMKQTNELGKFLDSLSDCVCFGIAPAILIYQAYTESSVFPPFALLPFCLVYIIGAVLRLTWFSLNENSGYVGITTPVTTSILLSLYFIDMFYVTFPGAGPILGLILKYIIPFSMILLPYLNISKFFIYGEGIRTRTNTRAMIFLLLMMTFGLTSAILAFFPHQIVGPYVYFFCVTILTMLVFYLGMGIYNYIKREKKNTKK